MASRMPNTFAAVAPLAGGVHGIQDYSLLASTPMWVAHNTGDMAVEFAPAARAVDRVEELSEPFHRIAAGVTTTEEDINHSKIFVVGESKDHDAWSGVYNNADFFKWRLKHTRESK